MNTLRGVSAPVGTLLGPGRFGRVMVVKAEVEGGVEVDYASPEEVRAAIMREDFHSLTEINMVRQRAASVAVQRALQEDVERVTRRVALTAARRHMGRTGGKLGRR